MIFHKNHQAFMGHISSLIIKIIIYLARNVQISMLLLKKDIILIEY